MTLTPNQREEARNWMRRYGMDPPHHEPCLQERIDRAQWQPHRNPESWWHRKWRKIVDWLDGGIE